MIRNFGGNGPLGLPWLRLWLLGRCLGL